MILSTDAFKITVFVWVKLFRAIKPYRRGHVITRDGNRSTKNPTVDRFRPENIRIEFEKRTLDVDDDDESAISEPRP